MYDSQILEALPHYQAHKTFLPHIPKRFGEHGKKIFIIGESHYLPKEFDKQITAENWYTNPQNIYDFLSKDSVGWINTRGVIDYFSGPAKLARGHRIFQNLDYAYNEVFNGARLFESAVYFNYFQRPAEYEGGSIQVHKMDSQKALENLMGLNTILQPDLVIFTSTKAYKDFNNAPQESKSKLPVVESVPHPACAWWHKTSKNYGINSDGSSSTGKQKFQRIIKTLT